LTLITGKKFDPAPLEATIATAEELDDVLIFGNNYPYPGALLLRSQKWSELSDQELSNAIWPQVDKLNQESQDHGRIPRNMLIPVEHQHKPLEKSSKGTIIRRTAETRFKDLIEAAYETEDGQKSENVSDKDLPEYLARLVQSMIQSPEPPEEDADLFSYGVDSIVCIRLRSRLRQLTPNCKKKLPLSIVEDCGTIHELSSYILRKRHGEAHANTGDENQAMLEFVKEFGDFSNHKSGSQEQSNGIEGNKSSGEVVVLTGATGALGAHILDLLRSSDAVSAIYCLVRGADVTAAQERVNKALSQRGLPDLSPQSKSNDKIKILQAALGDPQLGLSDDVYNYLAAATTSIFHIAWTVNFRLKLRSFAQDNLAGVRHLLDLALSAGRAEPPRFAYCSSTAASTNGVRDELGRFSERLSDDPSSASPLGYSRSKWVAEHICLSAHRQTNLNGRISVIRVGQLSGDSQTGIWNTKEAWPMMFSTARLIHCLPQLGEEPLDWLPVDIAAQAFVQAAMSLDRSGEDMQVYHVLNPHREPTWATMLKWLKKKEYFKAVPAEEWVKRLGMCKEDDHSAMKLLGLWKEAYGGGKEKSEGEEGRSARFSIEETGKSVEAIRNVRPLDEEYVGKVWEWVQENVH
jgi:thioester reductase-like protein